MTRRNIDGVPVAPPLSWRRGTRVASFRVPMTTSHSSALRRADEVRALALGELPSPIQDLARLRAALGVPQRILVKRDDAIPFGFGGNKMRKLAVVVAQAVADGADSLITVGGIQSNHARATAATAAKLGLRCHLVANGAKPDKLTGNALLDSLLGAEVQYVSARTERAPTMRRIADEIRAAGGRPAEIPLGASTSAGAIGFVRAVGELLEQGVRPDVIVHATSSGGTQAGLVAGCALHGLSTRVIGVSADDPAADVEKTVRAIIAGTAELLGDSLADVARDVAIEVDDTFVGGGYGVPTPASIEAQQLAARNEALFVDHTYTAKALAALIAYARDRRIPDDATVLFWHTGGQVGLFA
jgi:1-aminocyclopropane-1-carboxylate deaminase/D-cysteine desulfhydrase-like pyridoxal-dependent ACC family enzyme